MLSLLMLYFSLVSSCSTSWQRCRCVITLTTMSFHISHSGVFFWDGRWSWRAFDSFQSCKLWNLKSFEKSNKWVLNKTETPLFFLWTQLAIAVILFLISDLLRVLPDRLTFDLKTCKGLVPTVGLNVIGLRFALLLCRKFYSIHALYHTVSAITL